MTDEPATAPAADPARAWKAATAVLAVLALTLLVSTAVLRARADSAVQRAERAVAEADAARAEAAAQTDRNERIFEQMSAASERMAEALAQLPNRGVSEAAVRKAVADATRAKAGAREQTRVSQLCAQALVQALRETYAGADVESGAREALAEVAVAEPACRVALG